MFEHVATVFTRILSLHNEPAAACPSASCGAGAAMAFAVLIEHKQSNHGLVARLVSSCNVIMLCKESHCLMRSAKRSRRSTGELSF